MSAATFWGPFAVLTLIRLAVAAFAPLAPDEAYYWVWSHALAPGYLDHPPMVALWIRAGTFIAGQGPLGVRLAAPFSAFVGTLALAQAAEDFFPRRQAGLIAAWLLNATLLFGVGAVTMTPDTPLLFFWTVALWAMGRLLATQNRTWWLVAGAASGLALASKYTAILLPVGIALWIVIVPRARRWLRCWQSWGGGAIAVFFFSPILAWNATHHWASFAKQGGRGFVWDPRGALGHVAELIGGQAGLATPLVFVLCAAGAYAACRRAWREAAPGDSLLAALCVVPVLVFLQHALGDRVQANWPAIVFPAAAIASGGLTPIWRRLAGPAIGLGLAITGLVYVQVLTFVMPLPPRLDPTARLAGWESFAADVEQARIAAGASYVISGSYADAAMLARLLPGGAPVIGIEPRWALFSLPRIGAELAAQPGLLVQSARRRESPSPDDFGSVRAVGDLVRERGGEKVEVFHLYRVVLRADGSPTAFLPRESVVCAGGRPASQGGRSSYR